MARDDDDNLQIYWDELGMAHNRPPIGEPLGPKTLFDTVEPGDLVIGTSKNRLLVLIKTDGSLVYGPDYKPNKAAEIFWESMAQRREAYEDRGLIIRHMEAILVRLGDADMQAELAREMVDTPENRLRAEQAVRALERVMSQAIELGRGLARRPDIPTPAIPEQVPPSIETNPLSDYQGVNGLEET